MKTKDVLLLGALGIGAYFLLTKKTATDSTPTPQGFNFPDLSHIFDGLKFPNFNFTLPSFTNGSSSTSGDAVVKKLITGVNGGGLVVGENFVYNSPLITATGGATLVPANTPSGLTFAVANQMTSPLSVSPAKALAQANAIASVTKAIASQPVQSTTSSTFNPNLVTVGQITASGAKNLTQYVQMQQQKGRKAVYK